MSYNVALFITCLTDQFFPHVGIAVTKILEHFGCKVYFPEAGVTKLADLRGKKIATVGRTSSAYYLRLI